MAEEQNLFKNPLHPLDLNITDLNEIRVQFMEARQQGLNNNDSENGITLDYLAQILSVKLNQEASKIQKYLRRMTQFTNITWNQFLQLLDIESDLREKLLDWNMYEIKPKRFVEYHRKILKPLNRQTDRIYYILKALTIQLNGKTFMVLVFDDSTISIFDTSNFQIVVEFKIPYEFTVEMFLEQEKTKVKMNAKVQMSEPREKESKQQKLRNIPRELNNIKANPSLSVMCDFPIVDHVNESYEEERTTVVQVGRQRGRSFNSGRSRDSEPMVQFQLPDDEESPIKSEYKPRLRNFGYLLKLVEDVSPHLTFVQIRLVVQKVFFFIAQMRAAVKRKRHFVKYQGKRQTFIQMNAAKDYDEYLGKNAKHIKKMFQVFKMLPQKESADYCSKMSVLVQKRRVQSVSIDHLNNMAKNIKSKQKKPILDSSFQASDQLLKRQEQEQKIASLRRDLNNMTVMVDIDPRTLKARSQDPRNRDVFQKPKKFDLMALQREYVDGRRSQAKKSQENNMKKIKKKNMFVTTLAYCLESELLFVGLVNQEVQIFKFGMNEKNLTYYLKKVLVVKCPDVPKEMEIMRHRITCNLQCIILLQNNTIRIHHYSYKKQVMEFDFQPKWTTQLTFEAATLKFYLSLGFVVSSFQGEFAVFMDHYIKIPSNVSKRSVKVEQQQEKLFHMVLKKKLENKSGAISITCLAYSDRQKLLIFGSLNGQLTFFNLTCNDISSNKHATPSQIMELYCYDKQNQIIVISQDYTVSIWDLMRYEQIQCFKTIKDISEDFQYEMHSSLFSQEKGLLFIVGNVLQSWISVVDKVREQEKMKLQSNFYWREKSFMPKGQKVNNGSELYKILRQDEDKVQLPPNVFVRRKQPATITRILWVLHANDQVLVFESTKQIKVYNLPSLRLMYSFLFVFEECVEEILCFSATEDLKIIGMATLKQDVRIYNLYSQELLQTIHFQNHIVYLSFLHATSEYFYIVGQEDGQIIFCASYLKGNKKLQNKSFFNHKSTIICMERNDQFLISISEDLIMSIWSLSSCSLKKQLTLPITPFSLTRTQDELIHQALPAFVRFTNNPHLFFVITNAGDLHEYNAHDASLIGEFTSELQILNGQGCLLAQVSQIITLDDRANVRTLERTNFCRLKRQSSIIKKRLLSNPARKSSHKKMNSSQSEIKDEEAAAWLCKMETLIQDPDFTAEMLPKKILIHLTRIYIFCAMKKVYVMDRETLQMVSMMQYENGQIDFVEDGDEMGQLDSRMIKLIYP